MTLKTPLQFNGRGLDRIEPSFLIGCIFQFQSPELAVSVENGSLFRTDTCSGSSAVAFNQLQLR